jgi:amino acid transporter
MRRFRVNPTVRALAIVLAISCLVVIFRLYTTLVVLGALLEIAFLIVIGFVLYRFWRERRSDISFWPPRARIAFYGAFLILIVNVFLYLGSRLTANHRLEINGLTGVAWLLVFPLCGYAIWRIWRDQHSYL